MNYIAIDTSEKHLTIVVIKDDKVYSHFEKECGANHSVALMVEVEKLLEKTQLDTNKLDFIGCVIGAGSFTGIRIGVSTVKALCLAYNKPCLAITSFDTLAYNKQGEGKILAIIDAGHDGYYVCGYENEKIIKEPAYILKDELLTLLKEYKGISSTKLNGIKTKVVSLEKGLINALKNKCNEKTFDYDTISPLYVRKSQAEEGRK